MARVTVEDCLEHKDNRFDLIMDASLRARQLARTAAEPGVAWDNDKPTVVALREIAAGMTDLYQKESARVRGLEAAETSPYQTRGHAHHRHAHGQQAHDDFTDYDD